MFPHLMHAIDEQRGDIERRSEAHLMLSERPANNGADAESARTRRILVVDDEAPIRELLNAVLSVEGYGVTTAEDGKQAIGLLERDRFDLIISDVRMPGLDRIAVLRAAKRIDPHRDSPSS